MVQTVQVKGLRELERAMRELPRRVSRRVLNASLMAGAQPIVKDAKARAPVLKVPDPRRTRGLLKRSISSRPVKAQGGHAATVIVYIRRPKGAAIASFKSKTGKSAGARDPFYAKFMEIEYGNSNAPAQPFLRPAFEAQKRNAVDVIKERIATRIQVEAEKLRRGS